MTNDTKYDAILNIKKYRRLWKYIPNSNNEYEYCIVAPVNEWLTSNNIRWKYGDYGVSLAFETNAEMGLFVLKWF